MRQITDEYGRFLVDPESVTVTRRRVNRPPNHPPRRPSTSRRYGLLGRIGLKTVRILGVDRTPVWLPILVLLAMLAIFTMLLFPVPHLKKSKSIVSDSIQGQDWARDLTLSR